MDEVVQLQHKIRHLEHDVAALSINLYYQTQTNNNFNPYALLGTSKRLEGYAKELIALKKRLADLANE